MTDQQSIPEPQTETESQKPRRTGGKARIPGGRWLWVVLMLILIGVGIQQLMALRFWETLDNEAGQIATVDGRLAALEAAMADQNRLREDVRQTQEALRQERALLGLDLIEQQIDAGWQIWLGTGRTEALMLALQNAQRGLSNQPGAAAQALRLAVGRDLAALKSQQIVELGSAVEMIDTVIASVGQLPLVQDHRVPAAVTNPAETEPEASASTLLERGRQLALAIANELWQAIRGMIRVQRLDRAEAGLIAPEQKVFLQQGLRLLLLDSRHALIMRNSAVYQQTLAQARDWIQKYTDISDTLVKADLTALQQLQSLNIDPAIVSLEDTRNAMVAARAVITGESVADTESFSAAEPSASAQGVQRQEAGLAADPAHAKGVAQ